MKWVRFPTSAQEHVVLESDLTQTLEGMAIPAGSVIHEGAPPFGAPRCSKCDKEWRRRGKENRPPRRRKPGYIPRAAYKPRYTLKDWENER